MNTSHNSCGECSACCRSFAIPELKKKAGVWCEHCEIGKSCRIYETRPEACVGFECLWLQSQHREVGQGRLGPDMRPDRCKVMFTATTNESVISAIPLANNAMNSARVKDLMKIILSGGLKIAVGKPGDLVHTVHFPDGGSEPVEMTPPDEDGMQWNVEKTIRRKIG